MAPCTPMCIVATLQLCRPHNKGLPVSSCAGTLQLVAQQLLKYASVHNATNASPAGTTWEGLLVDSLRKYIDAVIFIWVGGCACHVGI